ncbi:hypothetical protein [Robbsia andropogonis]|nr:hypothetical protein [Robbsia andropogonis]
MHNPFSYFRGRRSASPMLRWMALAILLIRGLLSNVVMFDTHAPGENFALVICSGRGPMFSDTTASNMSMANRPSAVAPAQTPLRMMEEMPMDGTSMPSAIPSGTSASGLNAADQVTNGDQGSKDMDGSAHGGDTICSFSAVLFAAVVSLIIFLLISVPTACLRSFRQCRSVLVANATPYRLARTRAPPLAPTH